MEGRLEVLIEVAGLLHPAAGGNVPNGRMILVEHPIDAATPHVRAASEVRHDIPGRPGLCRRLPVKLALVVPTDDPGNLLRCVGQRREHQLDLGILARYELGHRHAPRLTFCRQPSPWY